MEMGSQDNQKLDMQVLLDLNGNLLTVVCS